MIDSFGETTESVDNNLEYIKSRFCYSLFCPQGTWANPGVFFSLNLLSFGPYGETANRLKMCGYLARRARWQSSSVSPLEWFLPPLHSNPRFASQLWWIGSSIIDQQQDLRSHFLFSLLPGPCISYSHQEKIFGYKRRTCKTSLNFSSQFL